MANDELTGPFTIEIDIPITRRMNFHAVVDGTGAQIFHSKRIMEVFSWLLDNEIKEFTLLDHDKQYRATLNHPLSPAHSTKG